jgi:prepilin-type N-terminal cleavage/methylation domain-containing protein
MQMKFPKNQDHRGFTLVELLTVIAILAILAAVAVPSLKRALKGAHSTQTINNMRQWGIALQLYATDKDGTLPGPTFVNIDRWLNRTRLNMAMNSTQTTLFDGWRLIQRHYRHENTHKKVNYPSNEDLFEKFDYHQIQVYCLSDRAQR